MRKIFKYRLEIVDRQVLRLPIGAKILHVDNNFDMLTLWAAVDPTRSEEERIIRIVGTGHPIPNYDRLTHLGTVQMPPFVWHVFEH